LNRWGDPAALIHYYLQNFSEPTRPLNQAKVLLVGEAKVGKTSLARRLIKGQFDRSESMTEGLNIRAWPIPTQGQPVKLNV